MPPAGLSPPTHVFAQLGQVVSFPTAPSGPSRPPPLLIFPTRLRAFSPAGGWEGHGRDAHSCIAAGPPVLCTHSGSLEGTDDKGERCWEIVQGGGISGVGLSTWSGVVWGQVDAQQGVLGLGEGLTVAEHQPAQATSSLGVSPPPSPLLLHSSVLWNPSEDTPVTRAALISPGGSTSSTLHPFNHTQRISLPAY